MATQRAGDLAAGTMVAGYRITHRLGAGGVGTVYAAEEPTIKKRVAVKVLQQALAADQEVALRFEREARAANDVRHPAIVDVFAFGKLDDGRPYLVMSLLEGRSLRDELAERTRLPPREAWAILREIAEALAAAHDVGIVHRDLKPDNVFLERYGSRAPKPRLLDLGLAKLTARADVGEAEPMTLTRTGTPMGTPIYMAPEQWWGTEVDDRVDQYALGVTLFELLAGHPPFRAQQFMELGQQHLNETPPRLADRGCEVSDAIEAFVARLLAKTAADRFDSMKTVLAAGDAAFGVPEAPAADATATAPTQLAVPAAPGLREGTERERTSAQSARPPAPLGRFLAVQAALLALGPAALVAVGYAGSERHAFQTWPRNAGWGALLVFFFFAAGVVASTWAAARRARGAAASVVPWLVALLTGISGAFGTYTGWRVVAGGVGDMVGPERFVVLHVGMFEANLARFMGFYLAALLFLSIAASAGLAQPLRAAETLTEAVGLRRRESIAAAAALVAVAAAAFGLGAPSGALVAGATAAALGIGALLPPLDPRTAGRDELERGVAVLVAVALVFAVATTRVDARQAVLWMEQPTRAARAAEVVAAASERDATLAVGALCVVLLLAVEVVRIRRVARRQGRLRPNAKTLALFGLVAAVAASDLVQQQRFLALRDRLRAELEPQFSLFARLDPPAGDDLDKVRFGPHEGPALQISRNVVAVNAKPVAPITAIDSPEGAINIGRDLSHAIAEHAATATDAPIDLSVAVDREVPWRTVAALLDVARRSGARRAEILLTRGSGLSLPKGAPPEASWVLASDFVAVPIELREEGFEPAPDAPFGAVAPELVRQALAEEAVVVRAVR